MFFNTCSNGENVGVKNNVAGIEADAGQNIVRALADFSFSLIGIRLALFIKGHNNNSSAITHAVTCPFDERFFAFFQADGVNHRLALNTAQPRFNHFPFGRVDHDGDS